MKKNLKWRLSSLPTPSELQGLVKDKIITQYEARDILFKEETEEDQDKKSLESEIKFLRELVEKLSNGNTQIIETIKYIEKPYYKHGWYAPYATWCGGNGLINTSGTGSTNLVLDDSTQCSFSSINTN